MKIVFCLGFAVCLVLIFDIVRGDFDLDLDRSTEADTLETEDATHRLQKRFIPRKRYTPRKRSYEDQFNQDNSWDYLKEKRYTPRVAKRLSEELNQDDNLWDLYTAEKRFTPRKRLSDQAFDEENNLELVAEKRFIPREAAVKRFIPREVAEKRFIPRAVKRIAEVLEQPQNAALEQYLTQELEKRFTPRKRNEEDAAMSLFAYKRFIPRKRFSQELAMDTEDTMDQYTDQRTQKRYTPRKRLSESLEEQENLWSDHVPEDIEKRFTPRRAE